MRSSLPEPFSYHDSEGKRIGLGVLNLVSEASYAALDTLIAEISDMFASSPYLHIGCDEVSLSGLESLPEVRAFSPH